MSTVVRTTTWPETRARLAACLSPGDCATVATAYAKLTATELAWAHTLPATSQSPSSMEATRDVLERVSAAGFVLERFGWEDEADRAALVEALQDHVNLPSDRGSA